MIDDLNFLNSSILESDKIMMDEFIKDNNITIVKDQTVVVNLDFIENNTIFVLYDIINMKPRLERITSNGLFKLRFPLSTVNVSYSKYTDSLYLANEKNAINSISIEFKYLIRNLRKVVDMAQRQISSKQPYLVKGILFDCLTQSNESPFNLSVTLQKTFGLVLYKERDIYGNDYNTTSFY